MVIEPTGILFLLIVCAGVPLLAFKTKQRLGDRPLPMPQRRFFIQTIFLQLFLLAIAVAAAWRNDVPLLALPRRPLAAWGAATLLVAALLGMMRWRWPDRDRDSKERLYRMLPHRADDLPPYFALCAVAGICEETVYRGVATTLLARLTGSLVAAILISAVAFALAHAVQGWRSVVVILGIALAAQALVLFAASLFPAMAAHALYDAIAGVLMPRWYERERAAASE